jgi:hypothetical protein
VVVIPAYPFCRYVPVGVIAAWDRFCGPLYQGRRSRKKIVILAENPAENQRPAGATA